MNTIRRWGITFGAGALLAICLPASAQQSGKSLAETARRAREQKKTEPPATRVWTNDNIPAPGRTSHPEEPEPPFAPAPAPGATPPAASVAPAPEKGVAPAGEAKPAKTAEAKAKESAEAERAEKEKERSDADNALAGEQAKLESDKKDLELLEREYSLVQKQHFSNPAPSSDSAGAVELDNLESRIFAKQEEIHRTERQISQLQDTLASLNRELGPEQPPPAPGGECAAWAKRLQPLRDERARVEAQIAQTQQQTAAKGMSLYTTTDTGSMTSDLLRTLENRRDELSSQISAIQDEAQRAGVPPGCLR